MLELELCEADAGPKDPGAVRMLIDLPKMEKYQLIVVWN